MLSHHQEPPASAADAAMKEKQNNKIKTDVTLVNFKEG